MDYTLYRDLLAAACCAANVAIWSWVLVPNHVHQILVPEDEDGLRRAPAPVHRRYAGEVHALRIERHVADRRRKMRARLVRQPTDWRWSSVHAHLSGKDDGITALRPILERFPRFAEFIETEPDPAMLARLRCAEGIGRPLGDKAFIKCLEAETQRSLIPGKRGPKPASKPEPGQAKLELIAVSP